MKARLHLKIWLTKAGDKADVETELVGQGRVELLRRLERMGSLKKAAESMGMSYRLAWGRLKKMEEALGRPLVESGVNRRGGYRLTAAGQELITAFGQWEDEVRRFALECAPRLHDLSLESFLEAADPRDTPVPRDPADQESRPGQSRKDS